LTSIELTGIELETRGQTQQLKRIGRLAHLTPTPSAPAVPLSGSLALAACFFR
jgi:hypothetical protein